MVKIDLKSRNLFLIQFKCKTILASLCISERQITFSLKTASIVCYAISEKRIKVSSFCGYLHDFRMIFA